MEQRKTNPKRITREDVAFLLKLVTKGNRLKYFQLTDNGKAILEMAWFDQMSLPKISESLQLSEERVRQIYKREMRLLAFYIDKSFSNYQGYLDLKKENALLYEKIKTLTEENNCLKKKLFDKDSLDHRRAS